MIGLEDRQTVAQNILMAHTAGARLRLACETAGIELRTLQRWKAPWWAHSGRWQAARCATVRVLTWGDLRSMAAWH